MKIKPIRKNHALFFSFFINRRFTSFFIILSILNIYHTPANAKTAPQTKKPSSSTHAPVDIQADLYETTKQPSSAMPISPYDPIIDEAQKLLNKTCGVLSD